MCACWRARVLDTAREDTSHLSEHIICACTDALLQQLHTWHTVCSGYRQVEAGVVSVLIFVTVTNRWGQLWCSDASDTLFFTR